MGETGRFAVAMCLLVGLAGACARPRAVPSPALPADPEALFLAVRSGEARIVSLRARFTAETESRGERHTTDGVLVVKKPDRFRLRLMLPFGLTVFDYVSCAGREQISMPLAPDNGEGQPTPMPFSRQDFGAAFLRGEDAYPGNCTARASGDTEVVVGCARTADSGVRREIRIDRETGRIVGESSFRDDRAQARIGFDDFRAVAGVELPYDIRLVYPEKDVSVRIRVSRYEVNPALADSLFETVAGAGS